MEQTKSKKEMRFLVLEEIYKTADGDTTCFIKLNDIADKVNLCNREVDTIGRFLSDEGLIEFRALGGIVSITHLGVKEIEEFYEDPKNSTENFPPMSRSYIYVENMSNSQIQQGTINSSQTYGNSSVNISGVLENLMNSIMKEDVPNIDKEASLANVKLLKSQVALPAEHRDKSLMQDAWSFLSNTSSLISVSSFIANHSKDILNFLGI
ncbi:hypothetical protein DAY19_14355 [Halobacteriovorax vibrionivorans]|uniref:DUF4388 domain-containing protein n=1 Tax=Halobacteriovorax vibrionivorans TaxID=2152716 RepID=A0ABY0IDX7_9BACT|nr:MULTISPECIES: hypothetical protein [Halobacteriovorax]RZF21156.1 hypothetical protein DAY19_14355 [Halobacteriovorax vibrionivorans]TGD46248.1 hypothetical protein EP118_12665 [Halobacteriovorax sp. Y22]